MNNSPPNQSIWIGYEPRQATAFAVAKWSIQRYNRHTPIFGLVLGELKRSGMFRRPMEDRSTGAGHFELWDVISGARCATEFSISRFLVPHLAQTGWALFMDCDVLVTRNISEVFALADPSKALMCVKHDYTPMNRTKMDGQAQDVYPRKNWSSVMLFNCDHPANHRLSTDLVNSETGRYLHRMSWLEDDEIGELPADWNYLVGEGLASNGKTPAVIHYTNGLPDVPGHENEEYAREWLDSVPYAVGAL